MSTNSVLLIKPTGEATTFDAETFDLVSIQKQLSNPQAMAVRIGNKVLSKGMIACIGHAKCASNNTEHNLYLSIVRQPVRATVSDLNATLNHIESETSKQDYVLINDNLIFNRHHFQHAEENVPTVE